MMKKLILNLPRLGHGNWWVEITTSEPSCIYYFGPFPNPEEANEMCPDYIRVLRKEGFRQCNVVVKRCQPAAVVQSHEENQVEERVR